MPERRSGRVVSVHAVRGAPLDETWDGMGMPVWQLEVLGGLARRYEDLGRHAPRIVARREWAAHELAMPTVEDAADERGPYEALGLEAWLWGLPRRGAVLMLSLRLAGDLSGFRGAMVDTFWRTAKIRVDGRPVLEALLEPSADERARAVLEGSDLGTAYELVVLDDLALLEGPPVPGVSDLERAIGVSSDRLRKLLHRSGDTRWRPGVDHVDFPMHGNRVPGTLTAVGESVSVIVPYAPHIEMALILSAVRAVADLDAARRVRADTQRVLLDAGTMRRLDGAGRRERLQALAEELSQLQMRELETGLPLGAAGQDEFEEALLRVIGTTALARSTAAMLDSLSRAVRAERDAIERAEQREAEQRQGEVLVAIRGLLETADDARSAAAVFAAVTAVVAGVGLFAALAAVPHSDLASRNVLLKPALVAAGVATLAVLVAAALGKALYELTRKQVSDDAARRGLRALASGGLLGASALLGLFVADSGPAVLFWAAVALVILSVFVFALSGDFGTARRDVGDPAAPPDRDREDRPR